MTDSKPECSKCGMCLDAKVVDGQIRVGCCCTTFDLDREAPKAWT